MQADAVRSQGDVVEYLRRAVQAAWGAERAAALGTALEQTATAVWEIVQQPLDVLDVEPDFIAVAEE
jgi:hypothetical protein